MSIFYSLIKAVFWILGSIVLMHLAGFLGIFVVVAYPIWWLLIPQKTPCFFCKWKKVGEVCPACRCVVEDHKLCYPQNFRSVLLNIIGILVVTLISFAVIFLETKILSYYGISPLDKTVSFVIPTKGSYRLGEIFPLGVDLGGVQTNINTVRADISYDPQYLEVTDITTSGSFATIFVQKEINNEVGFARISGGVPNPGINCTDSSNDCHFASFIFKTRKPGSVQVKYLPTSLVLANDGQGSNIVRNLGTTSFLILPETVNKEEQIKQEGALKLTVLGSEAKDSVGQLHLYQGNPILETSVLGANTELVNQKDQNKDQMPSRLKTFLVAVQKYDSFILNFWKKLITH
jgi:hypothetical protein